MAVVSDYYLEVDMKLPAHPNYEGVDYTLTQIPINGFSECWYMTSIEIPDTVTTIDNHAFFYCVSLTSVEKPESLTYIGSEAFLGCGALTAVTIPESVTSIKIPDSITLIGDEAFGDCNRLTTVDIPSPVTFIGEHPAPFPLDETFYFASRLMALKSITHNHIILNFIFVCKQ